MVRCAHGAHWDLRAHGVCAWRWHGLGADSRHLHPQHAGPVDRAADGLVSVLEDKVKEEQSIALKRGLDMVERKAKADAERARTNVQIQIQAESVSVGCGLVGGRV